MIFTNKKLIVFDMDGTILDDDMNVSEFFVDTLKRLDQKGYKYTLASGRNYELIYPFLDKLMIKIPYIADNGSSIYLGKEPLISKEISFSHLKGLFKIISDLRITTVVYSSTKMYCAKGNTDAAIFLKRFKDNYEYINYHALKDLDSKISKITLIEDRLEVPLFLKEFIKDNNAPYHLVRSENNVYTLTDIQATKGNALEILCEIEGVDIESTLVFGDNYNDISMFEKAGISVVMKNSREEIKRKADYITEFDNNHDGVAEFLNKNIL